ncbi:MAG TPA: type II toxin-antitoxin system VapB family antitoxin [Terriglobia bacterium]|nr:type II toxin-antitoxin system VapB family antitoxin [Terriglobia bacterium]
MSRTDIEIDEQLIRKAGKLTHLKTKRQIVHHALDAVVKAEERKQILRYFGIENYLTLWDLLEPEGLKTYRRAARLSRLVRSQGAMLTTVDALIPTFALDYGAVLFTLDKDFSRLASFTDLKTHTIGARALSSRGKAITHEE